MKVPFARLLGIDPSDVDDRDIPIVAIAGSGGGKPNSSLPSANLISPMAQVTELCSIPSVHFAGPSERGFYPA